MAKKLSVKEQIDQYNKIVEDKGNYFDRVHNMYKESVPPGNRKEMLDKLDAATKIGKKAANEFMDSVRNWEHPDHETNREKYNTVFGGDQKNVEKAGVAASLDMYGLLPMGIRNMSYEDDVRNTRTTKDENGLEVKKKLSINNADDEGTLKKYRALMSAKHAAVGYDGDEQVMNDFWNDHSMSYD